MGGEGTGAVNQDMESGMQTRQYVESGVRDGLEWTWTPGRGWFGPWRYPGIHTVRKEFHWCMKKSDREFIGREEMQSTWC